MTKWYECAHCDAGILEQGCTCDRAADLDGNGYPTELTLKRIREWPCEHTAELLEYVRSLWTYKDYATKQGKRYRFATGGWSGNEDLIAALQENYLFWALCWQLSARGGLHIFKVLNETKRTKAQSAGDLSRKGKQRKPRGRKKRSR